jgi:hypothetical protein
MREAPRRRGSSSTLPFPRAGADLVAVPHVPSVRLRAADDPRPLPDDPAALVPHLVADREPGAAARADSVAVSSDVRPNRSSRDADRAVPAALEVAAGAMADRHPPRVLVLRGGCARAHRGEAGSDRGERAQRQRRGEGRRQCEHGSQPGESIHRREILLVRDSPAVYPGQSVSNPSSRSSGLRGFSCAARENASRRAAPSLARPSPIKSSNSSGSSSSPRRK